jgi:hypothetical protein
MSVGTALSHLLFLTSTSPKCWANLSAMSSLRNCLRRKNLMIDPLETLVSRSITISGLPLRAIVVLSKSEIALGVLVFFMAARDYYHARHRRQSH